MTFLPTKTKRPERGSGNYMSFMDGENRIRIVTDAATGWIYWVKGDGDKNKPVRVKEMPEEVPAEAIEDKYGNFVKEFYVFGVWNYQEKKVQILEVTQISIQERIYDLHSDEDWGDPKQYDIKINRIKKGERVEYSVSPVPHKDLSMEIADAVAEKPINLQALYSGKDPFEITDEDVDTDNLPI